MSKNHHSFIKEICAKEVFFYAFKGVEYAEIPSKQNKNKILRCFWSDEKQALAACEKNWSEYRVMEGKLVDFLENWCVDMADEGVFVGMNFDGEKNGDEISPLDLILEILSELKSIGKEFYLKNYDDYQDFTNAIKTNQWSMKRLPIVANPEKTDEIKKQINAENFRVILCKPYSKNGIKTIDFSCLNGLSSIKKIVILSGIFPQKIQLTGFEALYSLPNLRELDFDFLYEDWEMKKGEKFDLSQCKNLRRYEGQWVKNMQNLSECTSLEILHLRHFSGNDFSELSPLKSLREIKFSHLKCENANGLQHLPDLQKVELSFAKNLEDISALNDCPKLVSIHTERCPKLTAIHLKSNTLETAWLWHKIENLDFVKNCPNLNHLGFKELIDGNLHPIIEQKIRNFHFEKKKHYSHGLRELERCVSEG